MKRLLDVNVPAFFMAGDHPGHGRASLEPVQPFDEAELKSFDAFEKARRTGS